MRWRSSRAGRRPLAPFSSLPCGAARVTMRVVSPRRLALAAFLLTLAAGGCDRIARDPGKQVVAEVGGTPVTVAQLQAYLDANLVLDPAADPLPPRDLARVKSRLFDDYLDGEILVQEARRRGLTVSDAELAEYLGPEGSPVPAAREVARRDLLIQKLREAAVRADVRVDEARIQAWLAAHPAPADAAPIGRLRTLRFASYPEAMRVRTEIVSKKLSFEQAQSAYGADAPGDDAPETDLGAFPDHISSAVKSLTPGQVSQPLPFESSVLLFLLDTPAAPSELEARRRDQAERAITLAESQRIADELLDRLRASTPVVRHAKQLPFPYVADSDAPRAQ